MLVKRHSGDRSGARSRAAGFTLLELVLVVVILGIVAAGTSAYIVSSMEGFVATERRAGLAATGRAALERISRELRNSLPASVRVAGNCVEYLPVVNASYYLTLPDSAPGTSFEGVKLAGNLPAGPNYYVVVDPLNAAEIYAGGSPVRVGLASVSAIDADRDSINLAAAHAFARHSAQQRFYIISDPVSFCVVGDQLRRYSGYGLQHPQPNPPGGGVAMADSIQLADGGVVTPFRINGAALQRNAIVQLDLRLMAQDEWVRLKHEVQVRNVP